MQILSHRGAWSAPGERNTLAALARAFEHGLGLETDIRDSLGEPVICHDPPTGPCPTLVSLLELHAAFGGTLPLALDIKADGLAAQVASVLDEFGVRDAFAFDMSVPEMLRYARAGLPYFTRHSDVEPDPVGYESAAGVWLDAFHSDWFGPEDVRRHLDAGKRVALVSPELHGRPPTDVWNWLRELEYSEDQDLMICTDHPRRVSQMLQEQP